MDRWMDTLLSLRKQKSVFSLHMETTESSDRGLVRTQNSKCKKTRTMSPNCEQRRTWWWLMYCHHLWAKNTNKNGNFELQWQILGVCVYEEKMYYFRSLLGFWRVWSSKCWIKWLKQCFHTTQMPLNTSQFGSLMLPAVSVFLHVFFCPCTSPEHCFLSLKHISTLPTNQRRNLWICGGANDRSTEAQTWQ